MIHDLEKSKIFHQPRFLGNCREFPLSKPNQLGGFCGRVFGRYNLTRPIVKLCIALFPFDEFSCCKEIRARGFLLIGQSKRIPQQAKHTTTTNSRVCANYLGPGDPKKTSNQHSIRTSSFPTGPRVISKKGGSFP